METLRRYFNFCILVFVANGDSTNLRKQYVEDLTNFLSDQSVYDKNVYPPHPNGPIKVDVSVVIGELKRFSEIAMSFELDIFLTQIWNDPRLISENENYTSLGYTSVQPDIMEMLWVPDTYFPNVKEATIASLDKSLTHKLVVKVNSDGNVLVNERISLNPSCNMNLIRYPFDRQLCKLSIQSYSISNKTMHFEWNNEHPLRFQSAVTLPEYFLINYKTINTSYVSAEGQTYSRLNLCFLLERKTMFYFMGFYFPSTIMVVISWLSSANAHSTFSDLVSVMLAQFFLYFSYATVMPKVSDVKALDVFLAASFLTTFLCLFQKFFTTRADSIHPFESNCSTSSAKDIQLLPHPNAGYFREIGKMLKRYLTSSATIPTVFIIFCVLYFITYFCFVKDFTDMQMCEL